MKKLLLAVALFSSVCGLLRAQPYGNEWIDYSQTHYKIKVAKDGIYRIPYAALSAVFPNLGSVNAGSFVMYHNGQAVPIRITSNTTLGPSDYIEFYGRKNIGDVDSFLYKTADIQPHPYYSLYTDTAVYFLTVKTGSGNPRYTNTQNSLVALPAKQDYFMHIVRSVYTGRYYEGKYYNVSGEEVYKSNFEDGEGFVGNSFFGSVTNSNPSQVVNQTFNIATPYINYNGGNAVYKTVFVNNSNESHAVRIGLNSSPNVYTQSQATGFRLVKQTVSIPLSTLNNTGNNVITFTETANAFSKKQNAVYMNEITYPRSFNFDGQNTFYFNLPANPSSKLYLEITNFNDDNLQPVLYDLTNNIYITSTSAPGTSPLRFALPPSNIPHELYLFSGGATSYNTVSQITPVQFINYSAGTLTNQAEFLIVSNKKLNDGSSTDIIEQYRQYRDVDANPSSGKFRTRIYDIEQLYDQFAYGVVKSPLAIRNFVSYASNAWTIKPTHVLLIGKAREYTVMRTNTNNSNQCLVPTFGYPGSDNLLVATRTSDIPMAAIGRLAAENRQQVEDYLEKLKAYEQEQNTYNEPQTIAPKIWQKRIVTFSGGTSASEQVQFRVFNDNYLKLTADTLWGAKGVAYSRTSNAPIEESQSLQIKNTINEGVSLVTFFGHSATGAFDFSVDEPENYTNKDRYPVFISNGCFAGLIHDATPGYSERFVFKKEAGTIAFIATTSLSLPNSLDKYTKGFYKEASTDEYTHSIGKIIVESLRNMYTTSPNNFDYMAAYEFTLHGDPGLKLNQYAKPDYAIEQSSVFFNPATVTPGVDSFQVNLIVTNLGRAIKDTIAVTMKRISLDVNGVPQEINVKRFVKAPYHTDTLSFTVPTLFANAGYGLNEFEFYVEADFEIDEMSEQNNGLLKTKGNPVTITITSDDIIPIYPYEFSIIPNNKDTLKASTINPFAPVRPYRFEIDTSELFIAPLGTQVVTQGGGVVKWAPNLTFKDSTVYYWRVAFDTVGVPLKWHYTSFLYLAGKKGWNQSHHYQYRKDSYFNVKLDSSDQIFKFPPSVNEIKVITGKADAVGGNLNSAIMGWDYNNNNMHRYRMGGCGFTRGITFAVINNITGQAWSSKNKPPQVDNYGDLYGNYHCSDKTVDQYGFDFATSGTHANGPNPSWSGLPWSTVIKNFIDAIPNNYYVLIYSDNDIAYTGWDTTLIQALQNLGMAQALSLSSGQINGPFVFFTQKGNQTYPSVFESSLGYTNPLVETINFNGVWFQGNFSTPVVGPAFQWTSMHWIHDPLEPQNLNTTDDIDTLDLIGITAAGAETVLLSTTQQNTLNLNTIAPANTYPYLRMRLRTKDDTLRTPTQLKYWRIMYEQVPEAAMNPSAHFVLNDNIPIGGKMHLEIALENVTNIPMDSMLTKFTLRDAANAVYIDNIRFDSLRGLHIMDLVYDKELLTDNYTGTNKIIIEANPDDDQLEQYHFNNFAEINFNTIGDKTNPLLDVTFDGQHILNGDIVSAKPNILISLKDENKFLALNDTSLVSVFLKYPGESTPRRMEYDNLLMTFYPADSNNLANGNKAQIELKPTLTIDGTYELIIKDRDRSGNNSSQANKLENNLFYDYKISFEVINKPMVTNVLNYPNPFTTSTRFVFTITGSQVPDYMKIQIMTIKGTVVKEITKEELGEIHMGRNITQYAWDGRDQYGDLLANGVYFYRVITRLDDKQMDHLSQGYDKYFKKGFGKLVIVR